MEQLSQYADMTTVQALLKKVAACSVISAFQVLFIYTHGLTGDKSNNHLLSMCSSTARARLDHNRMFDTFRAPSFCW